jgi:fatty acid-binding protein DegV
MPEVVVVTDSTANLPENFIDQHHIKIAPALSYQFE